MCCAVLSCVWFCDILDCRLPGSSVHGIFHARTLEWVAISFSRGSSQPKDQTRVSCIGRQARYHWATGKVLSLILRKLMWQLFRALRVKLARRKGVIMTWVLSTWSLRAHLGQGSQLHTWWGHWCRFLPSSSPSPKGSRSHRPSRGCSSGWRGTLWIQCMSHTG